MMEAEPEGVGKYVAIAHKARIYGWGPMEYRREGSGRSSSSLRCFRHLSLSRPLPDVNWPSILIGVMDPQSKQRRIH